MKTVFKDCSFVALQGDITHESVDVIVNAANSSLLGGGGVDGAIHRAAGPELLAECRKARAEQGECPPGHAVITSAGALKARFVVHTVGPIWRGGSEREAETLASCYRKSLELAAHERCKSVAFPAVSTGVYGYPREQAARIAVSACFETARADSLGSVEEIRFVLFDPATLKIYEQLLLEESDR
ncbi:MAG: O-acetyl-ADP-ribose deacetylase [Bdellovibrionota bacterium]